MDRKAREGQRTSGCRDQHGMMSLLSVCTVHSITLCLEPCVEGQRSGLGTGFCAGRIFPGCSLFLPHEHNRLFPSNGDILSSHQHLKQYFCYPIYLVIAWTQHMWGWSLGSCSPVASVTGVGGWGGKKSPLRDELKSSYHIT